VAVLVDLQAATVLGTDRPLFADLSVTVSDGDALGIVGINGTGKTTLLRTLAGEREPDEGIVRRGRGARVAMLAQVPTLPSGTVRQVAGQGWEIEAALDKVGMTPFLDAATSTLSGGQAKRVALAMTLATPSELLILDEPTNHLDLATVTWLEGQLAAYRGGLVIVSHDRYLLDRVTTRMLELDRGAGFLHEGGYASYLDATATREEQAEAAESTRRNLARRELAWLRRGAQARSTKPQARVDAARRLLETSKAAAARPDDLALHVTMPRLGDKVIDVIDASFAYPDQAPLLREVNLLLGPGDRLGIVGANGTGKSTLVDLLTGRTTPTTGTVEHGPTVSVGYYDQQGTDLDPNAIVQDLVAGPDRAPGSLEDVALMRRFWFTGGLPFSPVRDLSGGEKRRLQLLLVLSQRPNVLVLDEPTNDLDLDTLRMVEDFLDEFPGTLIVISHDRAFLERTSDRLVTITAAGTVADVPGGVTGWIQQMTIPARPVVTSPTSAPTPGPATAPAKAPGAGKRLRELDKEIARLTKLKANLMSKAVATTDHVELRALGEQLRTVGDELAAAEDDWLALATAD
jgi:ATP-binding cassette subfamily F protein uup